MKEKEAIVVHWLKSNGYRKVDVKSHWIEADSVMRKMAIKIELSDRSKLTSFKESAKLKSREPWIATVDPADNYVGWKSLAT